MTTRAPGVRPFAISRLPRIVFGSGRLAELPQIVRGYGESVLVVARPSFVAEEAWGVVAAALRQAGVSFEVETVSGEPSPALVDRLVAAHRAGGFDSVVGIGGGSVLDTAKAVAGLLRPGNSVMDHLEGVGPQLSYAGPAVPFIAVPTTAGTGSEATKNAVLSERGEGGFKKSFRDERLVAEVALVDPDLLATCPPPLIAADGMDAVTQLLESYVSAKATPFTDALALSGLAAARDSLVPWYEAAREAAATAGRTTPEAGEGSGGADSRAGRGAAASGDAGAAWRERMAYAALCSGICLAQAGLGAVHGIASPLGAFFPVPHGVACGAVLAAATRVNVAALEARSPGSDALARYAALGRLLGGVAGSGAAPGSGAVPAASSSPGSGALPGASSSPGSAVSAPPFVAGPSDRDARTFLVALLDSWRARLAVPRLSAFGITDADIPRIVAESRGSSMRTNPITLTDNEIAAILRESL